MKATQYLPVLTRFQCVLFKMPAAGLKVMGEINVHSYCETRALHIKCVESRITRRTLQYFLTSSDRVQAKAVSARPRNRSVDMARSQKDVIHPKVGLPMMNTAGSERRRPAASMPLSGDFLRLNASCRTRHAVLPVHR